MTLYQIVPICLSTTDTFKLETEDLSIIGPVRGGPEEDHKDAQEAGSPLLQRKAERARAVQSTEEKGPG